MPRSPSRKTSRKPAGRPASRPSSKRPRKRKPPQKHPPKKKNRFLRTLLWLSVAVVLVAVGYFYGVREGASPLQSVAEHTTKQRSAHPAQKSRHRASADAPARQDDLLWYGQREDALSDSMPDISWYEPGRQTRTPPEPVAKKSQQQKPKPTTLSPLPKGGKPRLVIIIDDVSHPGQLKAIRALPYRITPSIFPPSELSRNTPKLAAGLRHYMVHLPLESGSAAMNRMKGMLFVRSGRKVIQARVDEIRRLFPKARYVNNHTGSVYTADYRAMKRLYRALKKAGFVFVDSRTTAKTTLRKIARESGDRYIARDVFIDNVQEVPAIKKQLRQAVRIAKKRGYAIAIGHPHKATMQALRQAKGILKGVQTVYIDELFR